MPCLGLDYLDLVVQQPLIQAITEAVRAGQQEALAAINQFVAAAHAALALTDVTEAISRLGEAATLRLRNRFEIARIDDVGAAHFDFLPLPVGGDDLFGGNVEFQWPNGETVDKTIEFCERLNASFGALVPDWHFANVSSRNLYQLDILLDNNRNHKYSGKTDLVALPVATVGQLRPSSSVQAIRRQTRMVTELKTHITILEATAENQIIAELLLAMFFSEITPVHGVLTCGETWTFLWLVRDANELVLRRCTVHGWANGVRHLLAMLQFPVAAERMVPYQQFPLPVDRDEQENVHPAPDDVEDVDEAADGAEEGGRRVRPRLDQPDVDVEEMDDWYDADDDCESIHQRVMWALRALPQFATENKLNENSLNNLRGTGIHA